MTTKSALLQSGNPATDPPIDGVPATAPYLYLWQDVLVRTVTEECDDDNLEFHLQPAKVAGLSWDNDFKRWNVKLFYPKRPCSWLPDNWFDPDETPIEDVFPV